MLTATFRPLSQWPGKKTPSCNRKRAPFRAGYPKTLDDLDKEISYLNGKSVVVQIHLDAKDIRNDGWPRSSSRPKEPGVVVSFVTPKGPLSFPCDTYDLWEDNLRAISLSLTALRAVDRYGVTKHAEQYKGFAQIEAPGSSINMDRQQALAFVWKHANGAPGLEDALRKAALALHPDRPGGSHELFVKLQQAKAVLNA